LVVDTQTFISKAKRVLKDAKLAAREEKLLEKSENSMKKYPMVAAFLVEANDIEKAAEKLPPVVQREMIATLYEAIARNVLPMGEDRIQWMVDYIMTKMSDSEINSEWGFIRKGNVTKLVKLFQQLQQPGMAEKHQEKVLDLMQLHQEISEGINKTKEAGGEVDPKTFEFMEKFVMDFADDFVAEMKGDKLAGPKETKLLGSKYPALAKVLAAAEEFEVGQKVTLKAADKSKRYFRVLDSSGLGFGKNFDGQVLEFVRDCPELGQVTLKQPEGTDWKTSGTGLVSFDYKNVVEVNGDKLTGPKETKLLGSKYPALVKALGR